MLIRNISCCIKKQMPGISLLVAVAMPSEREMRIGLTMRQPLIEMAVVQSKEEG